MRTGRKTTPPLIDDRTYYVVLRVQGAPAPIWRSPWTKRDEALQLAEQKRAEVKRCGWNHSVEVYYRDGSREHYFLQKEQG